MACGERIHLLQDIAFFGAINEDSIHLLLKLSSSKRVAAGDYFYHQGDIGDCLYILEQGKVELVREYQQQIHTISTLGKNSCFGELALINCSPRIVSARATTDCQAIAISAAALHQLYQQDSEQFLLIQMNMAREACRALEEATQNLFDAQIAIKNLGAGH